GLGRRFGGGGGRRAGFGFLGGGSGLFPILERMQTSGTALSFAVTFWNSRTDVPWRSTTGLLQVIWTVLDAVRSSTTAASAGVDIPRPAAVVIAAPKTAKDLSISVPPNETDRSLDMARFQPTDHQPVERTIAPYHNTSRGKKPLNACIELPHLLKRF